MKRILILIFNWTALLTYSLWAIPLLIFYLSESIKHLKHETLLELIKDVSAMILIMTLFPIIFIISANLYVGFGNNKKILFTASPHAYKRWETFDICLGCYLITIGKISIMDLSDTAFGTRLDSVRSNFKRTVQLLLTEKDRRLHLT